MALDPGVHLGPYEIVAPIGSGGMGEVYRGRDTRLERFVAIKVLPHDLTSGYQARERFLREARAASALNHPHICTIYDVGTDPPFLAMADARTARRRLAHPDLASYAGISVTGDRSALVTTRIERRVGIWVGDGLATSGTEVLPPAPVLATGYGYKINWAGDRLLYPGAGEAILGVVPGVGMPEQIALGEWAAATPDGRTIVYAGLAQTGPGLFEADADGRHAVSLVPPGAVVDPVITADGHNVIYGSLQGLMIVPLEGGTPKQIELDAGVAYEGFDLSPDGKSMAIVWRQENRQQMLLVCDLPVCASRRSLTMPRSVPGRVRWTPDGRGISYVDGDTQTNLWVQPLDGAPAHQLTHFTDGRTIPSFAWSRDGKRLAVARETVTNDIVLFKGLKR
jgi:hypothetical protein